MTAAPAVTLVIPGRNCEMTLDRCLQSVVPLKESGQLTDIIFVDDGSTDGTNAIASRYPVRVLKGIGKGPGAARNLGWQATDSELVWFIDSDCVAEPDALKKLLPHMDDPDVAGVGGSYSNLFPNDLLACLIHEEIVTRHRRMGENVNFLATFNVIYRRDVLSKVNGFHESLKLAQDAELAYRIVSAGHQLHFEMESRVGHHHPRQWIRYLRTQCRQGFYRMMLYRHHPSKISGDSYANLFDYGQPPLACLTWVTLLAAIVWPTFGILSAGCAFLTMLAQLPMTWHCVGTLGIRGLGFIPMGFLRSHSRAMGMVAGLFCAFRPTTNEYEDPNRDLEVTPDPTECPDATSVSVIIPTRNRSSKVIKCLDSLTKQSVRGFEVVVVDDGSQDSTEDQLDSFATSKLPFEFVVVRHDQPWGANPSRNHAISKSRGEWIVMLDDDCIAHPRWMKKLIEAKDRYETVAVTGHVVNTALSNPWERFFVGQHRVSSTIRHGIPIARRLVAGNALIKREWIQGRLDEHRASVNKDMSTSGRGDEEGLRLALVRANQPIAHARDAIVYHDHPYRFHSFCKQAFRSGRSTAKLGLEYRLSPRWELLCFVAALLFLSCSLIFRPLIWLAILLVALFLAAALFNELCLKRRSWWQVTSSLPVLFLYYACRSFGYALELIQGKLFTTRIRQRLARFWLVRLVYRSKEERRVFASNPQWEAYREDWRQSRTPDRSAIQDRRPWLTYAAIDWLQNQCIEGRHVFEWGCGGSTLYFLDRGAMVTSVEHDAQWADSIRTSLDDESNSRLYLVCPPVQENDYSAYVAVIDEFEPEQFALVLIDGRARVECFHRAISKVAPGGMLVFDNADRTRYRIALDALQTGPLQGWTEYRFDGPTPYFWDSTASTRIWVKPGSTGDTFCFGKATVEA